MGNSAIGPGRFHKLAFYAMNSLSGLIPWLWWSQQRDRLLAELERLPPAERSDIMTRVRYYNRLHRAFSPAREAEPIRRYSPKGKSSAYYYDLRNVIRYFPRDARVAYRFGDVTTVPSEPRFVKSRPIASAAVNQASVLLKLNSVRHFLNVNDPLSFDAKKPLAVWRGKSNHPDRIRFAKQFRDHPSCDIGCVLHKESEQQIWHKPFMSIADQLTHQFVVSLEGIDVATNLKWIMASNSLCLMRRPRFETWFMEGALEPGIHYVQLKDDFSDLTEKINYYRLNPDKAKAIISNAQQHAARFNNPGHERLISLLVIDRYLRLSGQI
ncbi:MAG: glycosyl transferase family 90 [Pseudomonadota bacterium]